MGKSTLSFNDNKKKSTEKVYREKKRISVKVNLVYCKSLRVKPPLDERNCRSKFGISDGRRELTSLSTTYKIIRC